MHSTFHADLRRVWPALLVLAIASCVAPVDDGGGEGGDIETSELGTSLSIPDVLTYVRGAGFPCSELVNAGSIIGTESGFIPDAVHVNPPSAHCPAGSRDRGLWQINDCWHPDVSDACAFDPTCSSAAAHAIYGQVAWGAWSSFGSQRFIDISQSVQAALNAGAAGCGPFGWAVLPGAATDIGVGANGSVWVIGASPEAGGYGIYIWTGSGWMKIPGGAVRVAVGPFGDAWVVNSAGNIFHWTSAGWQVWPGLATDIGVGPDGSLWVIGTNSEAGGYAIYRWTSAGWNKIGGSALRIAVGPHGPWVINNGGAIFHWSGATWINVPGAGVDVGTGNDGSVWVTGGGPTAGGYGIFRWNGPGWTPMPGAAVDISIAPGGLPWVVNSSGNIFTGG